MILKLNWGYSLRGSYSKLIIIVWMIVVVYINICIGTRRANESERAAASRSSELGDEQANVEHVDRQLQQDQRPAEHDRNVRMRTTKINNHYLY